MDIEVLLSELSNAVGVGTLAEASDIAWRELSKYAECERKGLTVIGTLKGKSDKVIMLDAHIDEVAFIVTDVDEAGFVTVSKCGGIDLRSLPARKVTVHGKEKVNAVFCSTPPHLSSGEIDYDDITALKIDTLLGEKAREIVSVGDYVTYRTTFQKLMGSRVTGKSVDDRAGVVCLLSLAERLSKKELPVTVKIVFSDAEELGTRGAKTATYSVMPDEAIAIDVSFGDAPDVSPDDCGKLSKGAMIGYSPVLDKDISKILSELAKKNGIVHQTEVMGSHTGTNSDVISLTGSGVRTGLVSVPIRNMHTDVEVVDLKDIESVCELLEQYILSGGINNV